MKFALSLVQIFAFATAVGAFTTQNSFLGRAVRYVLVNLLKRNYTGIPQVMFTKSMFVLIGPHDQRRPCLFSFDILQILREPSCAILIQLGAMHEVHLSFDPSW